jgi:hypothetical protein
MTLLASLCFCIIHSQSFNLLLFSYVSYFFCFFPFKVSVAEMVMEKSEPEDPEMSINAKFRAIQPSPSILSYVEDNVRTTVSPPILYFTLYIHL